MTTETTATTETKRTRFTVNQALQHILDRIESYVSPWNEEAARARYTAMKPALEPELIEAMIASQKAKATKKLTGSEHDALQAEAYAIVKAFYAEEAKTRERVTLPSILEPLMASGAGETEVFFAIEGFVSDQAKKKAEALKKAAAASK